jgi:antitoxin VapB
MALSIKDPETDRLARELAKLTGESLTEAVENALRERLARKRTHMTQDLLAEELLAIGHRCASLPVRDDRSDDEILGYDQRGLPT